jgi:hypothetical protein
VVLASWKRGSEPRFYVLRRVSPKRAVAWREVAATDLFGSGAG